MTTKKLDLTKPVQTRDGRKVRILCTDREHKVYPVVGLVEDGNGGEDTGVWTSDGRPLAWANPNSTGSLVNVPKKIKVERWAVMVDIEEQSGRRGSATVRKTFLYEDWLTAQRIASGWRNRSDAKVIVAAQPVEFEVTEGYGLEGLG